MFTPIPRPKQMNPGDGYVPASLDVTQFPIPLEPAVRVFREYAARRFAGKSFGGSVQVIFDENLPWEYTLSVGEEVVLCASSSAGANHAFATLLQLYEEVDGVLVLPRCEIADKADDGWRGLMVDLARCWHEAPYLFAVADLCWLYKMNRLQLHFTDDQGIRFPFESFPEVVSEQHYTKEELQSLIRYCRDRDIVIVPEIDAPGHARAVNTAASHIFGAAPKTAGLETTAASDIVSGIMRADEVTFDALNQMFTEVTHFFPDSPYIHIGGDEADISKWEECPKSVAYRQAHGLADVHQLYGHYVARLSQMILDLDRTPVVWEGFAEECNAMIPKGTLVMAWESYYQLAPQLLAGGFDILNVAWKPLYIVTNGKMWDPEEILDWEKNVWTHWWEKSVASVTPVVVPKDAPIGGGQMCAWGDRMQPKHAYAPRQDMIREEFGNIRTRLPALAEKTWNSYNTPDKAAFMADLAVTDGILTQLL